MIDRAAILSEVLRRNALRKQACLPLLQVRAEFDRAVALAVEREIMALAPTYEDERQRILAEVQAEFTAEHPMMSVNGRGARMMISQRVFVRFWRYLCAIYAQSAGAPVPRIRPKHIVHYGANRGVRQSEQI